MWETLVVPLHLVGNKEDATEESGPRPGEKQDWIDKGPHLTKLRYKSRWAIYFFEVYRVFMASLCS